MEERIVRHKVDGPIMLILTSDLAEFREERITDGESECFIKSKDADGVVRGAVASPDVFAPTEDLRYLAFWNGPRKGWTHRLSSTGESLTKRLVVAEDRQGSWAAQRDGVYDDIHHFGMYQRALHNLDYILAVRVNGGRWAIIGHPKWGRVELASCGWTDEMGHVTTNNYAFDMTCRCQTAPLCVFNGEIKEKEYEE